MGSSAKWDTTAAVNMVCSIALADVPGLAAVTPVPRGPTEPQLRFRPTISPSGILTWSTTTALPAGRWNATVVHGGYLYVMGGCTELVKRPTLL